jgi:hypothetical protein
MVKISTIGIDIAKNVFQVHAAGSPIAHSAARPFA